MTQSIFTHQPKDYICPFCALLAGHDDKRNAQTDIVYRNEYATAFVAPNWLLDNPGQVLVVPNQHYENIYDIPDEQLAEVYKLTKKVALAIRNTYECDGISTKQRNEPAGGQNVWHLHVHIFPRHIGDSLSPKDNTYTTASAEERAPYAEKLRNYFKEHSEGSL